MVRKKKKAKPLNAPKSRADHGTPEALKQADGVQYETVDGGRLGSVKRGGINEYAFSDYIKLQQALGMDHVSVVRAVVVECESANSWAKRYRLPPRMGIERLRDGLDKLANVMGIS